MERMRMGNQTIHQLRSNLFKAFDFKNISRDELLEIVGNTMGSELDFNKGGAVIKKSIGPSDYRKGGMVLSTIDNRKK